MIIQSEELDSKLGSLLGGIERFGGFTKVSNLPDVERDSILRGYECNKEDFFKLWAIKEPLIYFKYASPEYELWADVKVNIDIEYIKKKTNLKESDLKEIWRSDQKKEDRYDNEAFKVFSREGQVKAFQRRQPIYYDNAGLWWLWNTSDLKWDLTDEVDVLNMINKCYGADVITSKARTEILNSLKQSGRLNKPKPFPPTWIQFKDRVFDVKTGESFESTPEYFAVNRIPHEVNHNPLTPTFDKIFEEWVGKEYVQTLYEILAYCLIPDYPINRMFCLIGSGSNGKSCFLKIMENFLGSENVCATELEMLLKSRFEIAKLYKKLACVMGETNFSEISQTSILKKLTGGDKIGFEHKNKTPFEDRNYAKIIIATNNLPSTTDKTDGFYRRWLIIDFNNKFEEKKDILNDIPLEEYKCLATKAVMMLKDILINRSFTNEGSVEERMKRYEDKSNPFEKFWKECIIEHSNERISLKQFKERLDEWCTSNKFRKLSDSTINQHMKEKGVDKYKKTMEWVDVTHNQEKPRYWVWEGIKWKD